MLILDGKKVAQLETEKLKKQVASLKKTPSMAIVQVGDLEESNKYIKNKMNKACEVGINCELIKFNSNIKEDELIEQIKKKQSYFDGIIVQLPLPSELNSQRILDTIDLDKDIDGLSSKNMNNFYNDKYPFFVPATASGIFLLFEHYNIDLNKNIMVIGESNLVGKPIKHILSKYSNKIESRNKTTGIKGSENFDILIVATGHANLIKKENIKKNSIIIDVGITVLNNKKIVGDVDFDNVKEKVGAISPVPGGVGPLTVICLLKNLINKLL